MKYTNEMVEIILASKSEVRKKILDNNNILHYVEPSNVDESIIKESLLKLNDLKTNFPPLRTNHIKPASK